MVDSALDLGGPLDSGALDIGEVQEDGGEAPGSDAGADLGVDLGTDLGGDGGVDLGADAGEPDMGPQSCEVAGVRADCVDVPDCAGVPIYGRCGALSRVCCLQEQPCSVSGAPGLCLDVAECPFVSTPGLCPGASNIQCCTRPRDACNESGGPRPNEGLVEVSYDPACPDGMVPANGFCIDRFEASLILADGTSWSPFLNPGSSPVLAVSLEYAIPQGYISGQQAAAACAAAGKRLCSDAEWLGACRGAQNLSYPYGDTREPGRCNDARARHPAVEYFGSSDPSVFSMLDNRCINQLPASLALTGEHAGCESMIGAFDMMGNLHEWTNDPAGTFRGGFYTDTQINGEGCGYRTTAHGFGYWDYSTGFRCCAELR